MLNKTINGYTIRRLIGSGGMSDVYYAENRLGKKAAIKLLKPELCAFDEIRNRFEQEARIMVEIEHRHICQAYDLGETDNRPAIIMEYLEGQTLKELIGNGKIRDDKARKYFEHCVTALRLTQAKDIVHRDIKPSNIIITGNDEAKILDFGIAKVKESSLGTKTNQMLGTPVYMSPEQIKNPKNVTVKSDVYSLAVTFYHALTGKAPYDSTTDSDYEIHTKIVNEDLDLSRVSASWASTLRPMLIKDPADRVTIKEVGGKAGNQKSDDGTQYDDPEPPKPIPNPKPTPASTSLSVPQWVYYLIGGIALAVAFMMGVRSCGSGEEITTGLLVYEEGNMYGYKDSKGTVVIPARYETASLFSDGRAKVTVADSVYYINKQGSLVELIKPKAETGPNNVIIKDSIPLENNLSHIISKLENLLSKNDIESLISAKKIILTHNELPSKYTTQLRNQEIKLGDALSSKYTDLIRVQTTDEDKKAYLSNVKMYLKLNPNHKELKEIKYQLDKFFEE